MLDRCLRHELGFIKLTSDLKPILSGQRNKDNRETFNLIKDTGRNVDIAVCDLADDKAVKALTKHVTGSKQDGGMGYEIDILVNCGGIQRRWARSYNAYVPV